MRNLLLIFVIIITTFPGFSQNAFKKTTFYFEVAGNAPALSLNYEQQLGSKPGFGLHVGAGLGDSKPTIPMGIVYMHDLGDHRSFLEGGFGVTLAEESLWDFDEPNKNSHPHTCGFIPSIGYRYHATHGFMLKIIYSPVFTRHRNIPGDGGISLGWRI